jgi:hypothetical protein
MVWCKKCKKRLRRIIDTDYGINVTWVRADITESDKFIAYKYRAKCIDGNPHVPISDAVKDNSLEDNPLDNNHMKIIEGLLDQIPEHRRTEIFHKYCTSCGRKNPDCQCTNDD